MMVWVIVLRATRTMFARDVGDATADEDAVDDDGDEGEARDAEEVVCDDNTIVGHNDADDDE